MYSTVILEYKFIRVNQEKKKKKKAAGQIRSFKFLRLAFILNLRISSSLQSENKQ